MLTTTDRQFLQRPLIRLPPWPRPPEEEILRAVRAVDLWSRVIVGAVVRRLVRRAAEVQREPMRRD